jgi:hypothetical protein
MCLLVIEAGILLRARHELLRVRIGALPFDEKVQVIGHETVRNYFKLIFGCGAHNLCERGIHDIVRREQRLASIGAKCQGISVESKIVERFQMAGIAGAHTGGGAKRIPHRPVKAGHYRNPERAIAWFQ